METTFPDSPISNPLPSETPIPPPPTPVDPEAVKKEAEETLGTMLTMLQFQATMSSSLEKDVIRIRLKSEEAGRLIGRRGSTINEIQFLLNRILQRRHKVVPRVYLDVDSPIEPVTQKEETPAPAHENGSPSASSAFQQPPRGVVPSTGPRRVENPAPAPREQPKLEGVIARAEAMASQVRRWGESPYQILCLMRATGHVLKHNDFDWQASVGLCQRTVERDKSFRASSQCRS